MALVEAKTRCGPLIEVARQDAVDPIVKRSDYDWENGAPCRTTPPAGQNGWLDLAKRMRAKNDRAHIGVD